MDSVTVAARDFLDRWVHPDAEDEPQTAARHRAFIAALLALSLFGACAFPIWIAIAGQLGASEAVFFAASATPLVVAAYLARTGRLDRAVLAFGAIVTLIAVWLGLTGASAPALVLLALVAAEAALATSRRVLVGCLALAGIGIALILLTPEIASATAVEPLAVGLAGVMAASTTLRIRSLHRQIGASADESETNYHIFADAVGGLVTRHDANGDALFASPASRGLLGASSHELLGARFVQRIQMSDRLAFLKAMKACVQDRKEGAIRLRMLRACRDSGQTKLDAATVEISYRPVMDPDSGEVSVVAVTRDWVETPQAESVNDVSALREPLKAIVEFSALLGGDGVPVAANTNAPDYARLIQSSANQMLDFVNGASARPETMRPAGRPNGQFLSAATKSKDQVPGDGDTAASGRNSGQSAQMKVFFPDFARGPGRSRQLRERTGG